MNIRKYQKNHLIEVSKLIQNTYFTFNKYEGDKKQVQKYIDKYETTEENLKSIENIFQKSAIFLVAVEEDKIIGMIRGDQNRIFNLFVYGNYHGKGIASKLVQRFEEKAKNLGSLEIKIHSSLYAIPFYQNVGYIKTTGIRNYQGLRMQPMRKKLK
jgi:GNAT superfamily N-acetyltransferase